MPDNGPVETIVKYNGDIGVLKEELGLELELLGAGYAVLTLSPEQIPLLYNYPQIEYVELPKILTLSLRQSSAAACVPAAREAYGLTGRGVLVGVIDSGLDYTHPDFRDEAGHSRVLYLWDQTLPGQPPPGFRQGSEYNNAQLNAALAATDPLSVAESADTLGHGTAVAGIAAGNGRAGGGVGPGVAPEAALVIVKLGYRGYSSFSRTTEVMRGVKYLLDKAELLNMPLVLNLSFGTNDGGHDGGSLFETYLDAMGESWKTVIVAAMGNEGAARHHFAGQIAAGQVANVDFAVTARLDSIYLTLWQDFADDFALELIAPDGRTVGELTRQQRSLDRELAGSTVSMYYGQPTHYNTAQEAYFLLQSGENAIPAGIWRLVVRGLRVTDGRFDIWLPTLEQVDSGAVFSIPSQETTLTLPASADKILSVGGYNSLLGIPAPFSGRGYTRTGAVKPDLLAPAVSILAPATGGGYDSFTGTSMAAPFVSGAAALMMQWGIVQGRDPALNYPNPLWGYGTLCLADSLQQLVLLNPQN